ncbi:hypothetical protein [Alkanindiges illinoisensis]|uniref:hypothetical protein n=1 Tax=Alkanindiges illinoisensis TaxID=197183 RepID=UPI001419B779|nr:hypothetical protein [Alkanindiges illinoisensis]
MRNHTSNSQLRVDGKMTPQGANRVGLLQAIALIIFALAGLVSSIGLLIWVIK